MLYLNVRQLKHENQNHMKTRIKTSTSISVNSEQDSDESEDIWVDTDGSERDCERGSNNICQGNSNDNLNGYSSERSTTHQHDLQLSETVDGPLNLKHFEIVESDEELYPEPKFVAIKPQEGKPAARIKKTTLIWFLRKNQPCKSRSVISL